MGVWGRGSVFGSWGRGLVVYVRRVRGLFVHGLGVLVFACFDIAVFVWSFVMRLDVGVGSPVVCCSRCAWWCV